MLILCTRDPLIIRTAQNPLSGSGPWGRLVMLDARYNRARATAALDAALRTVGRDEPVCFSAHACDGELGDLGAGRTDWRWRPELLALVIQNAMPPGYSGPLLIHTSGDTASRFAADLAVALAQLGALDSVWIHGYRRGLASNAGYPDPNGLDRNADLFAIQVRDALSAAAPPSDAPPAARSTDAPAAAGPIDDAAAARTGGYRVTSWRGRALLRIGLPFDDLRGLFQLARAS